MNKFHFLLVICLVLISSSAINAQEYQYIGAMKCKMCHNKASKGEQYNKWSDGPHAKAMETLKSEEAKKIAKEKGIADPAGDKKCTKCHSTAESVDSKLHATITVDESVSCESCHGPGSAYKSMSIMKSTEKSLANGLILPEEKVCKQCHNEESPTYKSFDYAEYSAKIAHPNPMK